jgi:Flp pilus assembly protein TadD
MDEAIADIKSALKLKSTRGDLYINLGIAYLKKGETTNAKPALQKAVDLGFNDAQSYIDNYC